MFLAHLLQTAADSDKIWYIVFWITFWLTFY